VTAQRGRCYLRSATGIYSQLLIPQHIASVNKALAVRSAADARRSPRGRGTAVWCIPRSSGHSALVTEDRRQRGPISRRWKMGRIAHPKPGSVIKGTQAILWRLAILPTGAPTHLSPDELPKELRLYELRSCSKRFSAAVEPLPLAISAGRDRSSWRYIAGRAQATSSGTPKALGSTNTPLRSARHRRQAGRVPSSRPTGD
jgi:hypothetical protein